MSSNTPFPLGIPTTWQAAQQMSLPDACLKDWLLDTSSLTERLQSQCRQFNLRLIGQGELAPNEEERSHLDATKSESKWQIREVLLANGDTPWVFARSVLPNALCQGEFADLGQRPLGKILFNDTRFRRQPFQLGKIASASRLHQTLGLIDAFELWARRSIFHFQTHRIMVAEVFLPDSPAYKLFRT